MSYFPPPTPGGPRPRRRRRTWGLWLVVVLLVAGVLVAGDRAGAAFAANEIQSRVATQLAANDVHYASIDVGVGGGPFLTQAGRGDLDEITIDLTRVTVPADAAGGAPVSLPSIHMVANGVKVDLLHGDVDHATAREITGTVVVDYATLDSRVDLSGYHLTDVHFSESGGGLMMSANATASAIGLSVSAPLSAVADISIADGVLRVTLRDVKFVSVSVPGWGDDVINTLAASVIDAPLPTLPYGLVLTAVAPQPEGLSVTAVGVDIPLAG